MARLALEILVILALIALNGVFAASELALVSARKARLEARAERGERGAKAALRLASDPGILLATVQIGITLISTVAGAFGGQAFVPYLEPALRGLVGAAAPTVAFTVIVVAITYVSLVVGELVPKRLALRDPERLATRVAPAMRVLARVARAPVWLLDASTNALLAAIGVRGGPQESVTEEDVRALVEQAAAGGSLEPGESEMIDRVLRFTDRRARDLMTPRPDLVTLDLTRSATDNLRVAVDTRHDHYPVHHGDPDEIDGVMHTRDLLRFTLNPDAGLEPLVRVPMYVPEGAWGRDILEMFRERRQGAALVVDEYGAIVGMVTLGDLVVEVVGDFDVAPGEAPIVRREDGSFLVDGGVGMHDVREVMDLPRAAPEDFSTIAGYVLHHVGRLPVVGESVEVDDWRLEVVDMDGHRVDRVLVTPPLDASADDAEA